MAASSKKGAFEVATYRSKDPISNLHIRVKLQRVSGASLVPKTSELVSSDGHIKTDQIGGSKDDEEVLVLKWQEKAFSKREVQMLLDGTASVKHPAKSNQALLDMYKDQVVTKYRSDPDKRPNRRIFSYTEADGYIEDLVIKEMTDKADEPITILSQRMAQLKLRPGGSRPFKPSKDQQLIVEEPSENHILNTHYLSLTGQMFYIMVDLSPVDGVPSEEDEHTLCVVKVNNSGVVTMYPDFNRHRLAYIITSERGRREIYEYTLEHCSPEMSKKDRLREQRMVREIYNRHAEYLIKSVGTEFEFPPAGMLRLNIFGEIVSAKNFEYDSLYVQYYIDAPKFWMLDPDTYPTGVTQRCCSKVDENGVDDVCYFSYPFDMELLFRNDGDDRDDVGTLPIIFFEVLSLDSWQRFRTEGYGYLRVPSFPGCHEFDIQCWRPTGNKIVSDLKRYFIGGTPELEDISFSAIPSTHQGYMLSKYGFRTASTGTLRVKLNVLMQSQLFLDEASRRRKKVQSVMDRLGGHNVQSTINSVLSAFMKARNRMRSAREGLLAS